jgi:hypothetical protein
MVTKPFLPSDRARPDGGQSFIRAATAELFRYARRGLPLPLDEVLGRFPAEQRREVEHLITRGDVSPATTTGSGWADKLVQTAVADFLVNIGPSSAASTLLRRGLNFSFDGAGKVVVPDLVVDADSATFVAEGAPIPVRNFSFGSGKTLAPRAFKALIVFTREVFDYTNAERQIRTALTETVGLALDKVVFGTAAEVSGVSPAGLLLGLSATTSSTTTPLADAIREDLASLIGAVAAVGGNNPVVLVAAPPQAVALRLFFGGNPNPPYEILASSALADQTVIAIATNCLCSVIDATLRFDVSDQAVLVMTDAGSEMVAATGGTSVIADPMRSMYQTDCLALRVKFGVNWALRNASGLAFMDDVSW